jgi:hypothetical protein
MAITTFEGRTLPSVFSDIPNRNALQEKETQLQEARKRIGSGWVRFFVLLGLFFAAIGAAVYFYLATQQANDAADRIEARRLVLQQQQQDYQPITDLRDSATKAREDLNTLIGNQEGNAFQDRLRVVARDAWRNAYPVRQFPGRPELDLSNGAQWWAPSQQQALRDLRRENEVMGAVTTAVQAEIDSHNHGGGGGNNGSTCHNPNPALCPT